MNLKSILLFVMVSPLFMSGCTSMNEGRLSEADRNQFVTEFYAYVRQVKEVKFESQVGTAAASWGLLGALEGSDGDRGDILGSALVGAFVGGLFTAFEEGPRDGYEYQLDAIDGDTVTMVVDHHPAEPGECVKVRVSGEVRIEKLSSRVCEVNMQPYSE